MGGAESQSRQVLKYFDKEWEYISTNNDGIKIFRNRDNDKEAEAHNVAILPQYNLNKQYDIYNYRRTQDTALVNVYAVNNLKDTSPNLCGNRDILKVMVQRIPIRGNQIKGLSFPEGVYLLSQSLRGYQDCYEKVGSFPISDQMMGLNTSGQVKVWLNENFGENHPPNEKPLLQITEARHFKEETYQEEHAMIESLLKVVQPKCKDKFPQDFSQLLHQQKTFCDTYEAVQQYSGSHNVDVPDRILMEGRENKSFEPMKNQNRVRDTERKHPSDFSFQQTNMGRETIINHLAFDRNTNHHNGIVQPHKPVTQLSFNTPNNYRSLNLPSNPTYLNSQNPNLYTVPAQHISYQQPKISLKPSTERGPSPARGVNFSYQNLNIRGTSPFGTHYGTSHRF